MLQVEPVEWSKTAIFCLELSDHNYARTLESQAAAMWLRQDSASCAPRPGVADSGFLSHYLLSDEVSQQAACQEEGSNYPAVTEQDIAAFSLPRFSLEEQQQIAEVLDAVDQTIQTTERVVAKLVKIREGLRRSQFADLVSSSRLHPVSECFDMTLGKMLSPAAKIGASPVPYLA